MISPPNERAMAIYARRNSGARFVDLAREYGLSPSRVQQIYGHTMRRLRTLASEYGRCPTCERPMDNGGAVDA